LWDAYNEDKAPRADIGKIVRIAVIAAFAAIIIAIASNQSVKLLMNIAEFGEVFTKPLYYSTISGLILAPIAVARVNFRSRHSMTWYGIRLIITFLNRGRYDSYPKASHYSEFKMRKRSFALWQLTKVMLFAPIFSNMIFGMTLEYVMHGNDIGLSSLGGVFLIPFSDLPTDGSYARQNVVPMLAGLTLLVPAVMNAFGIRLLLYVGISGGINVASRYAIDKNEGKPKFLSYISAIEIISGVAIFWTGFNMFFSGGIDYNTRYILSITIGLGAALISYGFLDKRHAKVIIYPTKRLIYQRLAIPVIALALASSIMLVNNSIADTKKVEWYGPHIAQEIAVNRYIHGLDQIQILSDDTNVPSISRSSIQSILSQNIGILNNIRLWDETNARSRLSQELGQRNDITYVDIDIVRFGNAMYWASTAAPVIPEALTQRDKWFNQHMVYTHSDVGVKLLEANTGNVIDESPFFKQHQIYYGKSGESGVFSKFWSAYPVDRTESFELGGYFYNGTGGIDIMPPLSWMFEPNFIVSDTTKPIHIMRYKDIHQRMEFLYPYFVYEFGFGGTPGNPQFEKIEASIVTDGTNTYWLMPLIVALDASRVPWSSATELSFMLNLVGFALVDAYNGTVQVLVTGNDYFSEIFLEQYKDIGATREVPAWLQDQIKYPQEMFIWKVSKFNTYHITDPRVYLERSEFYTVPADSSNQELSPYYIIAQPQGFREPAFVGLQYIQLKDSPSQNLVGYMVVENNLESLGKMTFYSIPSNSPVKLIGPETARTTLINDGEYKSVNEELKSRNSSTAPALGDNLLYKIGDHDVYFIPVMINNGEKIGIVGAVGALSSKGTNYVGLGYTPAEAFQNYLQKLSGVTARDNPPVASNQTTQETLTKIQRLEKVFAEAGLTVVKPTAIYAPLEFKEIEAGYRTESDFAQAQAAIEAFIERFMPPARRVFEWQDGTSINFGVLLDADGIIENHYISIEVDNQIGSASS
jgi:uncharacterized membrane protein (UPF0182 family)